MPDRARYDGPHTAVDVPLGNGKYVTVEQGHLLPEEHDGEPVPASLRDQLINQGWAKVSQAKKED